MGMDQLAQHSHFMDEDMKGLSGCDFYPDTLVLSRLHVLIPRMVLFALQPTAGCVN